MESQSREGGLDRTEERPGLRNPVIGIIGKRTLTSRERQALIYIGRCIARLGHTLTLAPSPGVADTVREGFEAEGGTVIPVDHGVIDTADHTLVYPDKRLLTRLQAAYPDLEAKDNVLVVTANQLDEWVTAVNKTMANKGMPLPT